MPLLERKPRAVFNAKPVRQAVKKDLLEWGMKFPDANRDTVKLLRLCLDYTVDKDISYADFLLELLKTEALQRQENNQKRRIKKAKYPYLKTIDEYDLTRLMHIKEPFIWELAGCDYIDKNQNNGWKSRDKKNALGNQIYCLK